MTATIDLNADLGEGGALDAALIPLASSVNIACGGHAGDGKTIRHTVRAALSAGVAIGAHPGYGDRANFGRVILHMTRAELHEMVIRQLSLFRSVANGLGAKVHHVKPHGALYNLADRDREAASAVIGATARVFPGVMLYCPPSGELAAASPAAGLSPVAEGFADRRHMENGTLVPRSEADAVIANPAEAVEQALRIATTGTVTARSGLAIPLPARTLCVHGDGASALALLASVRKALEGAGFLIAAP